MMLLRSAPNVCVRYCRRGCPLRRRGVTWLRASEFRRIQIGSPADNPIGWHNGGSPTCTRRRQQRLRGGDRELVRGAREEWGGPLGGCLGELAVAARDNALLVREVRVALAGPLASARLVTALPLVAVMFGLTLGFDTLGVLTSNPLGIGCLGAGVLLLWLGYRWNHALARRASRDDGNPALEHDLLAIALSSGVSIARAQQLVHRTASRLGLTIVSDASIGQVLSLAAGAGAPVADLLRSESARLRRAARIAGQERAAKLGVGLMAPLGLCVLPAFIVLGIAPLLMSVVTSTLRGS